MKPSVAHNVAAARGEIERVLGPRFGKLYIPNPAVTEYTSVLRFTDARVVTSRALMKALSGQPGGGGAFLAAGRDFTKEAREAAAEAGCQIISEREFGWTDADYMAIRQR